MIATGLAVFRNQRPGRLVPTLAILIVVVAVVTFSAVRLTASTTPSVEIISPTGTPSDVSDPVIDLASYNNAKLALASADTVLRFPEGTGLANGTLSNIASVVADDNEQAITFIGEYSFEGATVDAALVLDWPSNPGEEFSVSLGLKASSSGFDLSDIDASLTFPNGSPVVLGSAVAGQDVSALIAFSTEEQSVGTISGAAAFYAGFDSLSPGMTVEGTAPLDTVLPDVGSGAVVTVRGEIDAPVSAFNPAGGTSINVNTLALAGTVTGLDLNLPAKATSSDWAIGFEYDASEDEVTVVGEASLTFSDPVLGDGPLQLAAQVETSNTGVFSISAGLPIDPGTGEPAPWANAFGTDMSVDDLSATFSTVGGDSEMTLTGAVSGGQASASAMITITDTSVDASIDFEDIGIGAMASDIGSAFTSVDVPPSLANLKIDADVDFSYDQTDDLLQASALGTVTFGNRDATSASVLIMFSQEGNQAPVGFVSAQMDELTLGDLIPTMEGDFASTKLPAVALRANDEAVETADYDGQVQSYLQTHFCGDQAVSCSIPSGVALRGTFPVPTSLRDPLKELWIDVDSPFVIEGQADVFEPGGGGDFSLNVVLPDMEPPDEQDWFVSAGLSLGISKTGGAFAFGLQGDMTVKIPDESEVSGNDIVTFAIAVDLEIDLQTPSVSLTVTGGLSGTWATPGGVDWLTFTQLKLQIQVTVGAGKSSVVVGFRAGAQFCTDGTVGNCAPANTKDLDASFAIGVRTPVPGSPCNCAIDFGVRIASKAGVSLNDIVTIAEGAEDGFVVPASVKNSIPDVSLKNIELMISTIDSPELCLSEGLRITADLYVGAMNTTGAPNAEDLVDNCRTVEEQLAEGNTRCAAIDECYASVMFEVGANGIFVDASMSAIDLGPVEITGAGDAPGPELRLVISENTSEFSISGGIKIDGFAKATGSMKISDSGFELSVYVGDDKAIPENFFQVDASAQIGTATDPDALVFKLDVKLVLDIQDVIDAIYNDLFGWTGADYLEFRCIRLKVDNVTVTSGSVIPASGTVSVGIHVMVSEDQGDPLTAKKLSVQWDFGDDVATNVTGIIGDVFGGFQLEGAGEGCGLGGFIRPSAFSPSATPDSIVAREITNGFDTDPEFVRDGDVIAVIPRLRFPEPGNFSIFNPFGNIYSVEVGWGDVSNGTPETTETQVILNNTNGLPRPDNLLSFFHTVDLPQGVVEETRTVTFTVTHGTTGVVFTASSPITIISGAPHTIGIDDPQQVGANQNYVETSYGFRPAGVEGIVYDSNVEIDWGDGSTPTLQPFINRPDTSLITSTVGHAYSEPGLYDVTFTFNTLDPQGIVSEVRRTTAIVENEAPFADVVNSTFATRDPQTNQITPMPGGNGWWGYGVLAVPEGHELLLTTLATDRNYITSEPVKLTASVDASDGQDIPLTLSNITPDWVTTNAPISLNAANPVGSRLTLTYSDNDGGSETWSWPIAITPANQVLAGAKPLNGSLASDSSNTFGSPIEAGESNTADGRGGAVWWAFTPDVSGTYVVSDEGSTTVNGADQETRITVYNTTAGSSGSQGVDGVTRAVASNLSAGTSYLIGVQAVQPTGNPGTNPDASGPVELQVALAGVPANDDYVNFETLTPDAGSTFERWSVAGTTIAATADEAEPAHAGYPASTSVWYLWEVTRPGEYDLAVAGVDPRVAVYHLDTWGLGDPLDPNNFPFPEVGSNDDDPAGGFDSLLRVDVDQGYYLVAVDAYTLPKQSAFTMTIDPRAITNETPATKQALVLGEPTWGSNLRSNEVHFSFTIPYTDGDWQYTLTTRDGYRSGFRVRMENDDQNRPFPCGVPLAGEPGGTCEEFDMMPLNAGESISIVVEGRDPDFDRADFVLTLFSSNDFDDLGQFYWNSSGVDPNSFLILDTVEMNNFGADADDDGEVAHGGFVARHSTWAVLYAPDGSGIYEITAKAKPGSAIDTVMAIYDPTEALIAQNPTYPQSMSDLVFRTANNDDGASTDSRIITYVDDSQPIHIMVDGVGGTQGIFDLSYERIDVANDSFANAIDLTAFSTNGAGIPFTTGAKTATFEVGEPPHLGYDGAPSLWYTFTPSSAQQNNGFVFIDPDNPTTTELPAGMGFAMYKGTSLQTLEPVGGGFGGGTTTGDENDLPIVGFDMEADETYYIAVFGDVSADWGFDPEGSADTPDGDDIGDAIGIEGSVATLTGDTTSATAEVGEIAGSCFNDNNPKLGSTVWFRWRSSNDSDVTIDTNGSTFDTQLAIYEATIDGLSEVGCDDDDGDGLQSLEMFSPISGRWYYIQVDGYNAGAGAYELNVSQAPSEAFHALTNICTPLATGPLHAGADLDGPQIPGWGDGTTDTITFSVVGDIPADQYPFSPGRCEVPSTATAVFANVWVVNPANEGNMILSPAGIAPTGGVLNFGGDTFKNSNAFSIPISATGELDLKLNAGPLNGTSVKMVDSFILQVYGWYGPPETGNQHYSEALEYVPVTPCMFLETRPNREPSATFVGPYTPNAVRDVTVAGTFSGQGKLGKPGSLVDNTTCGIPDGTSHVMVNTELVQTAGGAMGMQNLDNFFGFMAFNQPQNVPMNNASAVVVPLDAQGEMRFQMTGVGGATSNVRMSVLGYYQPISQPGGFTFTPLTPCAVFDSRPNKGSTGEFAGIRVGGQTTRYEVRGTFDSGQGGGNTDCGIPFDAAAIDVSVEAVNAVREGNIVVSAAGAQASGGVLNFAQLTPKMNNANAVTVPISSSGEIDVFVNAGTFAVGQDTAFIRGVVTGYWTEG